MGRTVLSHTSSFVTAVWRGMGPENGSGSGNGTGKIVSGRYVWSMDSSSPLTLISLFVIGPRPIEWIRDYIVSHEKVLNPTLSSCFMYHGGTTIPQQFIYAAEILCVLMGGKPLAMVGDDTMWGDVI
jgi:hypothetical protein